MGRWARRTFVWMAAILTATAMAVAADRIASSDVAATIDGKGCLTEVAALGGEGLGPARPVRGAAVGPGDRVVP